MLDLLPQDILRYILSYLDNKLLLSIYAISINFAKFSKANLKSLLRENLKRTTRFKLDGYDIKRLVKLSEFPLNSISKCIDIGNSHSLVINDRHLYVFGSNYNGQLGLSDNENRNTPTLIPSSYFNGSDIILVGAGGAHSLVLTREGHLYAFGSNYNGQLGLGDNTDRNIPVMILPHHRHICVAAGDHHSMVLLDDGKVYVFGRNDDHQLGLGDKESTNIPLLLDLQYNVVSIAAGGYHSLLLTDDGQVYSLGRNTFGQLGLGNYSSIKIPKLIPSFNHNIVSISAGYYSSIVLSDDGNAYSFGYNYFGQLGVCDNNTRNTPTLIDNLSRIISVSAGYNNSLFLTNGGHVYTCGDNYYGQLGIKGMPKNSSALIDRFIDDNSLILPYIISISVGSSCSIILSDARQLYVFGENMNGQLGLGDYKHRNIPALIDGFNIK